jgi:hypothetical protein
MVTSPGVFHTQFSCAVIWRTSCSICIVSDPAFITAKSGFFVFLFLGSCCTIFYNLLSFHGIFLKECLRGLVSDSCHYHDLSFLVPAILLLYVCCLVVCCLPFLALPCPTSLAFPVVLTYRVLLCCTCLT